MRFPYQHVRFCLLSTGTAAASVAGTGQVGTAVATPRIVVSPTGVEGQGFVGSMSTGGNSFVQPTTFCSAKIL